MLLKICLQDAPKCFAKWEILLNWGSNLPKMSTPYLATTESDVFSFSRHEIVEFFRISEKDFFFLFDNIYDN